MHVLWFNVAACAVALVTFAVTRRLDPSSQRSPRRRLLEQTA